MVFSPREQGEADTRGLVKSGSGLSLNQLAGPDSGRRGTSSLTADDVLRLDNQHVRDEAGLWREKDAIYRRIGVGSMTPRGRAALHKQLGRYHSASQLAHLKSESRRASQRLAEAAMAGTDVESGSSNQAEEEEGGGAGFYELIADAVGAPAGSSSLSVEDASPPRRQSFSSRRSTAGSDLSTIPPLSTKHLGLSAALDESFSSSTYSPVGSMEFLNRDVEEEERALRSKSDKEKAFLYKLRYTDLYDHTVSLAKRVMLLEEIRSGKNEELHFLRNKVATQSRIIDTMSDNAKYPVQPADYRQEKKVQALCREVATLVRQLKERDSMIQQLRDDKDGDEPANELKMLKLAHLDSKASSAMDSSTVSLSDYAELEMNLDMAQRAKNDAQSEVASLTKKLAELERRYRASEAQRTALEDGLESAEEQLTAIQSQWEQEKQELMEAHARDDRKSLTLAAECDILRRENEALKMSLADAEKMSRSLMESNRRAAADSQAVITRLEAETNCMKVALERAREKDDKISALELDVMEARQKLERTEYRARNLQKDVDAREADIEEAARQHKKQLSKLEMRIFQAEIIRRSLHNQVMELKGNIRVFCRVRPVLRHERALAGSDQVFAFPDYKGERRQIELHASPKAHVGYGQNAGRDSIKKYNFDFDMVFDGGCSQEELFLEVAALIQSALDGYNVCIFAYGQTGSGKTYTMQGLEDITLGESMDQSPHMGIVGRAISHIFATMEDLRSSGWDFSASLEMIEIYNETLRDLLATSASADKVDLRLDADGKPVVTNSVTHTITNEREAWGLLQQALSRRSTKVTNMNDRSSRSHCVIAFRMSGVNSLTGDRRVGVVNLVDLAGSERLSKSGSDQNRELMKEAMAINKSLSSLGNVIGALAKKSAHVPFRDSKLTHLLSPSLGGDCKTLMICNLSPLGQHRDETLNSLRFAKTANSCEIAFPSISSRS